MNETDYSSANILSRLFSSISSDKLKETTDVLSAWNQTLKSIKSFQKDEAKPVEYGSQLADHSWIIDLQNEILIVETDHPGRIQMFQLYKHYILNGLKQKIPGIPIKNIVFKLRKPEPFSGRMQITESADRTRAADAATKAANAASYPSKEKKPQFSVDESKNTAPNPQAAPLPAELQALFSSMKEEISK